MSVEHIFEDARLTLQQWLAEGQAFVQAPAFYLQMVSVVGLALLAYAIGSRIRRRIRHFREERGYQPGSIKWYATRVSRLISPLLLLLFLALAETIASQTFEQSDILAAARRVALVWLLWRALTAYIVNPFIRNVGLWLLVPTAVLQLFGWFEPVATYLDTVGITLGETHITALFVLKSILVVSFIFWLTLLANQRGEHYIRSRHTLNLSTRELLVKTFQIIIYTIGFLFALNVVGIDLTALAVFGGALGVGLGFGLQKIASNFISGIILLMERSIRIGNLVELDSGTFGHLRKLGARASIIETFDGKEVMVPNEDFITSRVVNWTYSNDKTRIDIDFGVAYDTDMHAIPDLAIEAAQTHPNIANKAPRCWMTGYGDNSVDFMLSFWVNNLQDGIWEPRSTVLFALWDRLKEAGIEIPFPQRDVHLRSGLAEALKASK